MSTTTKFTLLLLSTFLLLSIGCSTTTPAKPYPPLDGYKNYKIGQEKIVTIGDSAIVRLYGNTWPMYQSIRDIHLDGRLPIPAGTLWYAHKWYPEKKALFLTSSALHPQLAILANFDGKILSKNEAAYQIVGSKNYRRWSLLDDTGSLKYFIQNLWENQGTGFTIYYLGRKGDVLRFSIAKHIKYASSNERLGTIEYTHDLADGNIFTIRGIEIQIDNVDSDGTLHYTVLSEKNTNELLY
jgi:hypothetical protein